MTGASGRPDDSTLKYSGGAPPDVVSFPPGTSVNLVLAVFKRESDSLEVAPDDHVVYFSQATPVGVSTRLCFNSDGVPPGRYQSTLTFVNPRLQASPVPVVVTIQEDSVTKMVVLALLAIIGGTVVMFVQSLLLTSGQERFSRLVRERWASWLFRNIPTILVGLGAVWGVWNSQYFDNETFGAEGTQYIQFFIACAAAFTSGAVAGSVATEGYKAVSAKVTADVDRVDPGHDATTARPAGDDAT